MKIPYPAIKPLTDPEAIKTVRKVMEDLGRVDAKTRTFIEKGLSNILSRGPSGEDMWADGELTTRELYQMSEVARQALESLKPLGFGAYQMLSGLLGQAAGGPHHYADQALATLQQQLDIIGVESTPSVREKLLEKAAYTGNDSGLQLRARISQKLAAFVEPMVKPGESGYAVRAQPRKDGLFGGWDQQSILLSDLLDRLDAGEPLRLCLIQRTHHKGVDSGTASMLQPSYIQDSLLRELGEFGGNPEHLETDLRRLEMALDEAARTPERMDDPKTR